MRFANDCGSIAGAAVQRSDAEAFTTRGSTSPIKRPCAPHACMIKTASQAAAQTDVLARTDARTFDERPHMRKEPFCARFSRKTSGFRMGGALRERRSAKQCVVLIIRHGTVSWNGTHNTLGHLIGFYYI